MTLVKVASGCNVVKDCGLHLMLLLRSTWDRARLCEPEDQLFARELAPSGIHCEGVHDAALVARRWVCLGRVRQVTLYLTFL
jgi:hypothetical protein